MKLGTALENNPPEEIRDLLTEYDLLDHPADLIEMSEAIAMEAADLKQILDWMKGIYDEKNVG